MKRIKPIKKLEKNKIEKGLVSLLTIIIVLTSLLVISLYNENNITANVIKETLTNYEGYISFESVDDVNDLNQLNEGWYSVRNGYVYYLETFDSYIPLYIKVKNPEQQNGFFAVDEDGTIKFNESFDGLVERK